MAAPLGPDLRSRVIAAVDSGASQHAAAERFGVGVATAVRWLRAWRKEGRSTALPMGGDVRSHRIEAFRDVILSAIKAQKDITLAELADMLRRDYGVSFASSTIWRFLGRHDVTFKENGTRQRAGAARRRRPASGLVRRPA